MDDGSLPLMTCQAALQHWVPDGMTHSQITNFAVNHSRC